MKKMSFSMAIARGSKPEPNLNSSNLEELSPRDLVRLSQKYLAEDNVAKSRAVLKMALSKDPECLHGLLSMSSLLMLKGQFAEAFNFLESVLSKPCPGHLLDFSTARLAASQLAATCCVNLGKPRKQLDTLNQLQI